MTVDAWLNQAATWPSLTAATLAFACVLVFGIGSPWYQSPLGAAILFLFVGMVGPLGIVGCTRLISLLSGASVPTTGDGLGAVRFTIYSLATLAFAFVLVMILVERRSGPIATFPVGRTGPTKTRTE